MEIKEYENINFIFDVCIILVLVGLCLYPLKDFILMFEYFPIKHINFILLVLTYIYLGFKNSFFYNLGFKNISFLDSLIYVISANIILLTVLEMNLNISGFDDYFGTEIEFGVIKIIAEIPFFYFISFISVFIISCKLTDIKRGRIKNKINDLVGVDFVCYLNSKSDRISANKALVRLITLCADDREKEKIMYETIDIKIKESIDNLYKKSFRGAKLFANKTDDEILDILNDLRYYFDLFNCKDKLPYEKYIINKEFCKKYGNLL